MGRDARLAIIVLVSLAAGAAFFLHRRTKALPRGSQHLAEAQADPRVTEEPVDERELRPVVESNPATAAGSTAATPAEKMRLGALPLPLDVAKREAMRTLIWQAFGRPTPAVSPSQAVDGYVLPKEPPPAPPGDAGAIDPKYIQEHVRNEFVGLARGCYEEAVPRLANPRGELVLWFTIVGDEKVGGIVESVDVLDESTLRDPELIECVRQSMLSVTFPPPKGGGFVTVKYPFAFTLADAG